MVRQTLMKQPREKEFTKVPLINFILSSQKQPPPILPFPLKGKGLKFLPLQGGGQEGDGVDVELRLTVFLEFPSPYNTRKHKETASFCRILNGVYLSRILFSAHRSA